MKFANRVLGVATAAVMVLTFSACNKSGSNDQSTAASETPSAAAADMDATQPVAGTSGTEATNWFGGPVYDGAPSLEATSALVKAGGGADNFSFATALVSMLGEKTVNAEVAKLTKQYGKTEVDNFLAGMTFAINDGLKRATEQGVKLPDPPADLHGEALAKALVQAGTAPDGTFWSGYLFDHALSHPIHDLVMADIDAKFSHDADESTHKILNQAMFDVAQALGETNVKLASLH